MDFRNGTHDALLILQNKLKQAEKKQPEPSPEPTPVTPGSATTPATIITATPTISVGSDGIITATVSASQSITPTVEPGYVESGTAGTVTVSGSKVQQLTTQAGTTITPTTSEQTAVASGRYTTGAVKVAAMPSGTAGTPTATKGTVSNHSVSVTPSVTNTTGYITGSTKTGTAVTVTVAELESGTKSISANGTGIDVSGYSKVDVAVPTGGSSKNVQVAQSTTRIASTSYTKTASLTCSVSGTYDVYWDCTRSSTSGTSGSQLYIGGSAYGTANTTFTSGYHVHTNHLTGVTINANQEVAVYVRSRGTSYYAYCGQLTIVQTS